jgi:AraC-like DNA-binding protein
MSERKSRSAVLHRLTKIADEADQVLAIPALCERLGVSPSLLQSICRDDCGMSAADFLRHRRLLRARAALLVADRPGQVTAIALSLGFAELGQFAAHYAKAFGELPSQTLSRRPTD